MDPRSKWDRLAAIWWGFSLPLSPSPGDINNYRRLLVEVLNPAQPARVIVLGCTPQLRELLNEDQFSKVDVWCVDVSKLMCDQMSSLMKQTNPREHILIGDWCTFDAGKSEFDAIIGDEVVDNVDIDQLPLFFANLRYHLRAKGGLIMRVAAGSGLGDQVSFQSTFNKWLGLFSSGRVDLTGAVSGLFDDLLDASGVRNTTGNHFAKVDDFSSEIEELLKNVCNPATPAGMLLMEFAKLYRLASGCTWSVYSLPELVETAHRWFTVQCTFYSEDYESAAKRPILLMRARG